MRVGTQIYQWSGLREDPWNLLAAWRNRMPPDAVFVGLTAAWLHGLDVDPVRPIEIAISPQNGVRSRPGLSVRRLNLPASEVTIVRELRASTLARTFRDLSRRFAPVELLVLADEALRLRLGRFHELAEPAESPMETRLRWLLIKAGLPAPQVQARLHDADGHFVGRADLYYPSVRLVIEFDGGNHRDRMISDNRRQNQLISSGYRVLRFTGADLRDRPEAVIAQVRAGCDGLTV